MMRMAIGLLAILAPLQLVHRRPARAQHAQASADQDRGDGRPLGRQQAGRLSHLRLAGREGRDATGSRFRSRAAPRSILTHDPNGLFPGLKSVPPQRAPAGAHVFFALPHHARHRLLHDRGGAVRRVPVVARHAVRDALVSAHRLVHLVDRLCRGDRGLGRHRKRAPALARARHPAHRRRDLAGAGGEHRSARSCCSSFCYGIVFSMGIYYINRLIAKGPQGRAHRGRRRPAEPSARRRRSAAARRHVREALTWNGICPVIWAALIGTAVAMYVILDGFDLGIGILFPFAQERRRARPDDALDRAVLGRQRDLAGARRRRIVGGVSGRLCGDHAGLLSAGDRDAAGAGLPRRGVRIPARLAQQDLVEFRVHRRLDARGLLAGRDPRRADPGHQGAERRLRRRAFRLGDAVRASVRAGADRGLCAAWRDLADHEDRRRGRRARARAGEDLPAARARVHGGGVSLWTPLVHSAHRRALVLAAEFLFPVAGADRSPGLLAYLLWRWIEAAARRAAVRRDASGFFCSAISGS